MFAKVNLGVKKFVSLNAKVFVLCIFLANMRKWQKMHSNSEKYEFLPVFLISTEGI